MSTIEHSVEGQGDEILDPTIKPLGAFLVISLWGGGIILGLAILFPLILKAREAARQTHSRNNLKQLGIALHNYHDSSEVLPPGGSIQEDGTPHHGWMTSILPYLDSSPVYSMIDFDKAWDHPFNIDLFRSARQQPAYINPSSPKPSEKNFYALTHYLANPALLHRNSSVEFKDFQDGTAHTWMVGEVADNFPPAAYPFNWRAWNGKTNRSATGYGLNTQTVTQFLLSDGSVKAVRQRDSAEVYNALKVDPVDFSHPRYAVPPVTFPIPSPAVIVKSTTSDNAYVDVDVIASKKKDSLYVRFRVFPREKGNYDMNITADNIAFAAKNFPQMTHLSIYETLTPEHLQELALLKLLRELKTNELLIDEQPDLGFIKFPALKKIHLSRISKEHYNKLTEQNSDLTITYDHLEVDSEPEAF